MRRILRCPAFALSVAAVFGSQAAAADPPLPADLRTVPADAAVFVHVDFATVWDSKLGETFRAAKAKDLETALAEVKKQTTIGPEMIKTVTIFMPHLSEGDFEAFAAVVSLRKPFDRTELVKAQKTRLALNKVELTDKDGILRFKPSERSKVVIDASNPMRLVLLNNVDEKYLKERPAGETGAVTPALRAAAEGATATLGLNMAALPDELRGDNLPAEARPFQPLFRSDSLLATARMTKDDIKLELRFRNGDRIKTADAEKSLAAGALLIQTALGFAIGQLEKSKEPGEKAMVPLAKEVIEIVKAAKISVAENEAIVSTGAKTDLPFGPVLQSAFGGSARSGAARASTQNNLKQLGLAMHNYHDAFEGFPPSAVVSKKGKPMLSWRVLILPYTEQHELYKQFRLDEPWDSDHNKKILESNPMPKVYALPGVSKDTDKETHFQVFTGKGAAFDPIQATKIQTIADGTSNTILVGIAAKPVLWTKPDDMEFDPKGEMKKLLLFRDGGTSVVFADGSVRFIQDKISEEVLRAAITKDGGEVVDLP